MSDETRTIANLQAAFAGKSQANRKYLAFAQQADKEGFSQVAKLFRAAAEAETIHAHNHLRALEGVKVTCIVVVHFLRRGIVVLQYDSVVKRICLFSIPYLNLCNPNFILSTFYPTLGGLSFIINLNLSSYL